MYNRYLDGGDFVLLDQAPVQAAPVQEKTAPPPPGPPRGQTRSGPDLMGEVTGGVSQLLEGVFKHFSIQNFDTGDILLVLIILFLYLEGDNLELVITLGLLLLLGLGDDDQSAGS